VGTASQRYSSNPGGSSVPKVTYGRLGLGFHESQLRGGSLSPPPGECTTIEKPWPRHTRVPRRKTRRSKERREKTTVWTLGHGVASNGNSQNTNSVGSWRGSGGSVMFWDPMERTPSGVEVQAAAGSSPAGQAQGSSWAQQARRAQQALAGQARGMSCTVRVRQTCDSPSFALMQEPPVARAPCGAGPCTPSF
jgi:hypothetical protein